MKICPDGSYDHILKLFKKSDLSMLKIVTMAAFLPKPKPSCNVRSISFPARLHPSVAELERELNKISSRQLQAAPCTSKAKTICDRLSSLGEIHKCIEDLLDLPMTQQALSQHQDHEKLINDMLDDWLRYLDVCSKTRDGIISMKESVRDLQSALRRSKAGGEMSIEGNVNGYICSRKKLKKEVAKSLALLKQLDGIRGDQFPLLNATDVHHHYLSAVIRVLKEASLITASIFGELMAFLSAPILTPRASKWSSVSKWVQKGVVACESQQENLNELENVDVALSNLLVLNSGKDCEAQKKLEVLDTGIEEIENKLESLFRHLIHARVSFLNILSH